MNLPAPTFRPYGDLIQIEYDKPDTGTIILPGSAKLPPWVTARAIACGDKCTIVKPGDVILVNSGAIFNKVKCAGVGEVSFTKEDKIMAVVTLPEVPMLAIPTLEDQQRMVEQYRRDLNGDQSEPIPEGSLDPIPFPASSPEPAGVSDPAKE